LNLPALWSQLTGHVPEIDPIEFKRWLDEGRPLQIVDARTALEFRQGTIGDARHASLTEMPASMERLALDPAWPVVVLCLSGHRSRPGVKWLLARGFRAFSLQGGIMAWKRAGYELNHPNGRSP
jgi:rhodanese-related sulfurtransferase